MTTLTYKYPNTPEKKTNQGKLLRIQRYLACFNTSFQGKDKLLHNEHFATSMSTTNTLLLTDALYLVEIAIKAKTVEMENQQEWEKDEIHASDAPHLLGAKPGFRQFLDLLATHTGFFLLSDFMMWQIKQMLNEKYSHHDNFMGQVTFFKNG